MAIVSEKQLFLSFAIPTENLQRGSSSFNFGMLSLAREALGFSQKDLAHAAGCNQSRISKIEAGELLPQVEDVRNFAKVLERSSEFFFRQGTIMPASVSFYRKTQTMPLKMFRRCNAQMNIRRLEIEQSVGNVDLVKRERPYLPPDKNGGAEAVARMVRGKWGIGKGAVLNLTKLVEETGCIVVDFSFPTIKLDGLCIQAPQKPPIIFLNKDLPKSRRRFSLAHELGHLIMHINPHEKVEEEAMEFAAELLMPAAEIGRQLDGLNLDKLGQLKKTWGVSMQAILYRARKLNRIAESHSRYLWMQIGKCGYRVNEPFEDVIPDEIPMELEKRLKPDT